MKLKLILNGLATYIPGAHPDAPKKAGATDNARYCYSVWARHLINAHKHGLNTDPRIAAELGPGASLGIGLAALISGCEKYYAFDMVRHADTETNLKVFEELIQLFENKTPVPDEIEFPRLKPRLESYVFPESIFNSLRMEKALDKKRLEKIRSSIHSISSPASLISYKVPWSDPAVINPQSVDIVYSQAVLEHVDELESTYQTMHAWLRPGGHMSHQIDFKCHDCAAQWNGHWTYTDLEWKLIRGKRPYLINRESLSTHQNLLSKCGFKIVHIQTVKQSSALTPDKLAPKFRNISAQDLTTSSAFILARKK